MDLENGMRASSASMRHKSRIVAVLSRTVKEVVVLAMEEEIHKYKISLEFVDKT